MGPVEDPMAARTSEVAEGTLVSRDFVDCYQTHCSRRLIRALQLSGADQATAQDVAQEAFARAFAGWGRSVRHGAATGGVRVHLGLSPISEPQPEPFGAAQPSSESATVGSGRRPGHRRFPTRRTAAP